MTDKGMKIIRIFGLSTITINAILVLRFAKSEAKIFFPYTVYNTENFIHLITI